MRFILHSRFFFFLFLLGACTHGFATNYYINGNFTPDDVYTTNGGINSISRGLSPNEPLRTIQYLLDTFDLNPGDTVFIDAGVYREEIILDLNDQGSISGDVVFKGAGSDLSILRIESAMVDQIALNINQADYLTFQDIGFEYNSKHTSPVTEGYGVITVYKSDHISFKNCRVLHNNTISDPNDATTYEKSTYAGIKIESSTNITVDSSKVFVLTNEDRKGVNDLNVFCLSFYGDSAFQNQNILISNSSLFADTSIFKTSSLGISYGAYSNGSNKNLTFNNNHILANRGIFFNHLSNSKSLQVEGLIMMNNYFYNRTGCLYFVPTTDPLALNTGEIVNNNFFSESASCFILWFNYYLIHDLVLVNNIFQTNSSKDGVLAFYFGTQSDRFFKKVDYNIFYAPNYNDTIFSIYPVSNTNQTFSDVESTNYQSEQGNGNENSLNVDPHYQNLSLPNPLVHPYWNNLDVCQGDTGESLPSVTTDIYGAPRNTPYIGAHEFMPSPTGLSGFYTINPNLQGSRVNYQTLADLSSDIENGTRNDGGCPNGPGLIGDIEVELSPGNHYACNTQFNSNTQVGYASYSLTFFGANTANRPKITASCASDNLIEFYSNNRAFKKVRWQNVKFETDVNTLKPDALIDFTGAGSGDGLDSLVVERCMFVGAQRCLRIIDNHVGPVSILNNDFVNHNRGAIYLNRVHENIDIENNNIDMPNISSFSNGIYTSNKSNNNTDISIKKNKIFVNAGSVEGYKGIYMLSNTSKNDECINNVIKISGSGSGYSGIDIHNHTATTTKYIHNSVFIDAVSAFNSNGIFLDNHDGTILSIVNNIIYNLSTTGTVLHYSGNTSLSINNNYNNLAKSPGSSVVQIQGLSLGANSIGLDPEFNDSLNLTKESPKEISSGMFIDNLPADQFHDYDDILGKQRDNPPHMGAYEFTRAYYYVGNVADKNWENPNNWAYSTGGPPLVDFRPLLGDIAHFDDNSFIPCTTSDRPNVVINAHEKVGQIRYLGPCTPTLKTNTTSSLSILNP